MTDTTSDRPFQYTPTTTPPQTPKVDGLAIASLVLGILWLYWIGSILAIIFAAVALKRISKAGGWRTGKGMAIAGLVLGLVGAATLAAVLLIGVLVSSSDATPQGSTVLATANGDGFVIEYPNFTAAWANQDVIDERNICAIYNAEPGPLLDAFAAEGIFDVSEVDNVLQSAC